MEYVVCRYKPASNARRAKPHRSGAWESRQAIGVVALGGLRMRFVRREAGGMALHSEEALNE